MKRSKIFALMSAAVIAVSGSSAFISCAADNETAVSEQVCYIPEFNNVNLEFMGNRFVEWQEMTEYLGFEEGFAAVSEKDRLLYITENEDGTCTCRRIAILPACYFVKEEDSVRLEEYLKGKHPQMRINKKKFKETDEEYFFTFSENLGYEEETIDLAMAVKAELGLMCYANVEDEEFPVTNGNFADIPVNEDIAKILSIPFEEFLNMTNEEICAISPEAEKLFGQSSSAVSNDMVSENPNVVFKSVEGLLTHDETGWSVPTEELERQLSIPGEYISYFGYGSSVYASDYGRRYYEILLDLDPTADSAHTDRWTRTRLLTRIYAAGEAEDNIFSVSNEHKGGGGYSYQVPEGFLAGDANCDGVVSIADATAIMQYIGNKDEYALTAVGLANADCYDPGSGVTGMDALAVQQKDAKAVKALPVV